MGGLFLRLRTWWETADRTQKVVTIFGGSFLMLLLVGTFYFGTRPKMAMAWGGLAPAEQGRVVAEIQKLGIPVEYDLQGGVLVPSDKVTEVQATLSRNGVAPTSGHMGNSELSSLGMMSTKPVEDARLKAIQEGEIAKSIETISGVAAARVLLSGGNESPFASDQNESSASVTVTERFGGSLGANEGKAIASLVARSVPGLTTKNVTIVNQEGTTIFDGAIENGQQGQYTAKLEAQINEAKRIKRELQPILDNAFGPGNTLLTTRVEMDFDKTAERETKPIASENPISKETAKETMGTGAKPSIGGAAGGASNGLGGPAENTNPNASAAEPYSSEQEQKVYAEGHVVTEREKAPGTITSLAISVLVDSKTVKNVKPVEDLIAGFLGPKEEGKNYAYKVTATEFDRTNVKKVEQAVAAAGSAERMQQIMSLLPIGALILVAFVVIKSLGKAAKSSNVLVQALPDGRLISVGGSGGAVALSGVGGHHVRQTVAPDGSIVVHDEAEEEEDVYEEIEDDSGQKSWKPKKRKKGPKMEDIEDIPDQINVPLEQIKKMGNERPGVAAMLIKSWLITD
ncbi:MAG TPA: flagellar basal-body MS-ring/collar protein FliF [Fimbriimonadaceae bacterium]|nr:flagellar basal-body MS-ring/collar protein FliF [Fimbriimonadaceae bacterium]